MGGTEGWCAQLEKEEPSSRCLRHSPHAVGRYAFAVVSERRADAEEIDEHVVLQGPLPAGEKLEDGGMAHRGEGRERVEQWRERGNMSEMLAG